MSRLHEAQAYRKVGFTSFGDFSREILGIAFGTVKDRLRLHEVLVTNDRIAASFFQGDLSESKAIALLPVVRLGLSDEAVAGWIATAREMGVRQLRVAVREALRTLNEPEDTVEDQDAGEDVEGRTVSFHGPVPVVRMFDSAIETARKVLGRNAPRYECVEAMLAETSSMWQRMEPDLEERLEQRATEGSDPVAVDREPEGRADAPLPESPTDDGAQQPAESGRAPEAGVGAVNDPSRSITSDNPIDSNEGRIGHATAGSATSPSDAAASTAAPTNHSSNPAPAVEIILVTRLDRALLNEALRTAERIEREIAEIAELIGKDDPDYEAADSHSRPMAIEASVRPIGSSTTGPITLTPTELQSQIDRIVALEQLDAPLRIYRAEILRQLRDSGAISSLGFSSWASFAQDHLGLSDRSTRSLVAEGRLFSLEPTLRDAYGRGEIPIGKAFLLRRIAGSGRVADQIDRASAVTHRQLAREVRLIEWARQLGARLFLSRSAEEMEETLLCSLFRWGWTRERVHGLLDSVGLSRPSIGDPTPGGRTVRDGSADMPVDAVIDPATAASGDSASDTHTGSTTEARSDPAFDAHPGSTTEASSRPASCTPIDPATDPGVMNRLERLIDLLILTIWDEPPQGTRGSRTRDPPHESASDDRRTSTHANSSMEVRFWAPEAVAHDWRTALARIRQQNGIGCPPWVAVSMLVAEAIQEWERQDPKKHPHRGEDPLPRRLPLHGPGLQWAAWSRGAPHRVPLGRRFG